MRKEYTVAIGRHARAGRWLTMFSWDVFALTSEVPLHGTSAAMHPCPPHAAAPMSKGSLQFALTLRDEFGQYVLQPIVADEELLAL